MAYIGVGGDTSVQWIVYAENVRQTVVQSHGRVHRHEGIDETAKNAKFTIFISAPPPREERSRSEFYRALQQAIDDKSDLEVTIPIQDSQRKRGRANLAQVQVRWTSRRRANVKARVQRVEGLQSLRAVSTKAL